MISTPFCLFDCDVPVDGATAVELQDSGVLALPGLTVPRYVMRGFNDFKTRIRVGSSEESPGPLLTTGEEKCSNQHSLHQSQS